MEDIVLLDAIERYLKGEMSPQEKTEFEQLRKTTPEVDMMVVEHNMFLNQMEAYGDTRNFKHQLHELHNQLVESGDIDVTEANGNSGGGKVIQLWRKYKRVIAIAASIAGVTAILISTLVTFLTPVGSKSEIRDLGREIERIKITQNVQSSQINAIAKSKIPTDARASVGGTSFLIDGKGYLVTNAHVVSGASTIVVMNTKGQEFKAKTVRIEPEKDLAILKIDDEDFKPIGSLPYTIRKGNVDLGEQIFTLGYPRDEIVYNEGYMSAKTGFNGDTISCQIAVSANPGNSGGPILNKNGEVIGILSTAQQNAQGVVFAIKSKHIYQAIDSLRKDTTYQRIKMPVASTLKGMDRVQQIKHLQDCVFMVRSFTK
jgi:serine protease Do